MELSPETLKLLQSLPAPTLTIAAVFGLIYFGYVRIGKPFIEQMIGVMEAVGEQASLSATMTAEAAAEVRESAESVTTFQGKQIEGLQKMYNDAVERWEDQAKEYRGEIKELRAKNLTKDELIAERDQTITDLLKKVAVLEGELQPLKKLQANSKKEE